jgi:hypothetical protein
MESLVEFDSVLFRPYLPDEAQVNPQVYGAELAYWLSRKLAERGVVTSYPAAEDWGWFLEYGTDTGDDYWLCCANAEGTDHRWRCFVERKGKGLLGLGRKPPKEGAARLVDALRVVLEHEKEITNLSWGEE